MPKYTKFQPHYGQFSAQTDTCATARDDHNILQHRDAPDHLISKANCL